MRDVHLIEGELDAALAQRKAADADVSRLVKELAEAKVAAADHPWLGKKVERDQLVGYRRTMRRESGTVVIFDPNTHRRLRGNIGIEPGAPAVISASGKTVWSLDKRYPGSSDGSWRLIEEKAK